MSLWQDFKAFVNRGNVMDLAVGVIIGGAFGKIVTSLVNDILTPLISLITGGADFSHLHARVAGPDSAPVTISYGAFLQAFIDFLLIALIVFILVRFTNRFRHPSPVTTKDCPFCKMPISKDATRCPHCTSQLS